MMLLFLMSTIFLLSLTFIMTSHPMLMGVIIMLMTFLITIISGLFLFSFWMGYILFLVYLGALLVLFVYMTSLSPNEIFQKNNTLQLFSYLLMFMTISIMFNNSLYTTMNITFKFNKLFSTSMFPLTIMVSIFLLFSLFSIMKITKFYSGPLRMMFN